MLKREAIIVFLCILCLVTALTPIAFSAFPTGSVINGFVDNLNRGRFIVTSDAAKTFVGSANFTDGLIVANSPGWFRSLCKGLIVAGATVAGGVVGGLIAGPVGAGVGAGAGAAGATVAVQDYNSQKTVACCDATLYEAINVPTMGDIVPTLISTALAHPNSSYDLSNWDAHVANSRYGITFTNSFGGKVVDINGVERPGVYAVGFVITEANSGHKLFGIAYFNTLGNLVLSDRSEADFGIIPDTLIGSPVNYTGAGLLAYSASVGGVVVPVDKFGPLAPYIGLASTTMIGAVAAAVYVKRVKRRKEKQ